MKTIEITLCLNGYTLIAVLAFCVTVIICAQVIDKQGGKHRDEKF